MWGYLIEHYQKKKCLVDGEHWPENDSQGFRFQMCLVKDQDLHSPTFQRKIKKQ